MAVTNSVRAEEGYIDKKLSGVWPGSMADRWTNDYANRDQAVKGGLSTTLYKNGVVTMQNIITFYRPTTVAPSSNGYRAMRNFRISCIISNRILKAKNGKVFQSLKMLPKCQT